MLTAENRKLLVGPVMTLGMAIALVAAGGAAGALADWDPGDPYKMHYPQLPDLEPTGMDVYASTYWIPGAPPFQKYLADDWMCSESGPVSDIHIWGSWLNDQIPQNDATHGTFDLAIYADVPADATNPYSHPGEILWSYRFTPSTYLARHYADGEEQFYDPNIDMIIGADTQVWQYNFLVDEADAFIQEEGTIYWLGLTESDPNEDGMINELDRQYTFGWKTSLDHWNDDAVFGDYHMGPWAEMHYPSQHQLAGESIDLAFVITPEPATLGLAAFGALFILRRTRR